MPGLWFLDFYMLRLVETHRRLEWIFFLRKPNLIRLCIKCTFVVVYKLKETPKKDALTADKGSGTGLLFRLHFSSGHSSTNPSLRSLRAHPSSPCEPFLLQVQHPKYSPSTPAELWMNRIVGVTQRWTLRHHPGKGDEKTEQHEEWKILLITAKKTEEILYILILGFLINAITTAFQFRACFFSLIWEFSLFFCLGGLTGLPLNTQQMKLNQQQGGTSFPTGPSGLPSPCFLAAVVWRGGGVPLRSASSPED